MKAAGPPALPTDRPRPTSPDPTTTFVKHCDPRPNAMGDMHELFYLSRL